jgi:uncharacterized tellurite resistance protein B-like protein
MGQKNLVAPMCYNLGVYHGTRGTEKMRNMKDILTQNFSLDQLDVESLVETAANTSIEILSEGE